MENIFENIEPNNVFNYFAQICAIPHVSYHTDRLKQYIRKFAEKNGLEYFMDGWGNIIVFAPASEGYEDHDTVIIQGHLDMVGAVKDNCFCDFTSEPVKIDPEALQQGIIKAVNTSLGGDNGIAVAYMLAILSDKTIMHPAIEAVFTTDEEMGLIGASHLDCSMLKGKTLLNIDSEEEGTFLMGSAGGLRLDVNIPVRSAHAGGALVTLTLCGLKGGHSGDKIGTGRPSANVLMGRIIREIAGHYDTHIVSINGGTADNVICSKCIAGLIIDRTEGIRDLCLTIQNNLNEEYSGIEDNITIFVGICENMSLAGISGEDFDKVLMALLCIPSGVIARNHDNVDLVETSLNIGIINADLNGVSMGISIRSSYNSAIRDLADRIRYITGVLGGTVSESGEYPSWSYNPDSNVRRLIGNIYKEQTGREPEYRTIHAGLECGIFSQKMPGIDIVSYGPDIRDIHTCKERVDIESVRRVYELTVELLGRM